MKKVLITGAGGFVGRHLIDILKTDYHIIAADRQIPNDHSEDIQFVSIDITQIDSLLDVIKSHHPEYIIHLAGIAQTWKNDFSNLVNVNFLGTHNLYQATLESNYQKLPKILFVSSSDVYGNSPTPNSIDENSPLLPLNFYATSKVAADRLSYQYSQTTELDIVIARPFPHIGPGQQKGFFVSDTASQIAEIEIGQKDPVVKIGNTDALRDYTDVRDVCRAYKALIESDTKSGDVFNISSQNPIKISDLLEKLLSRSQKQVTVEKDPGKIRTNEPKSRIGNSQKLIEKTGWHPQITIEQSLQEALDYWRSKITG